jgi:hypothetical protein
MRFRHRGGGACRLRRRSRAHQLSDRKLPLKAAYIISQATCGENLELMLKAVRRDSWEVTRQPARAATERVGLALEEREEALKRGRERDVGEPRGAREFVHLFVEELALQLFDTTRPVRHRPIPRTHLQVFEV